MKLPTFSAFALGLVLSLSSSTSSAFQVQRAITITAKATPRVDPLGVALNNNNDGEGLSEKKSLFHKLGGDRNDHLGDNDNLSEEQGQLLLQVINGLEHDNQSNKAGTGAPSSALMSKQLASDLESRPPSLLQLAFRLITKEIGAGRFDLEWVNLMTAVAFLNVVSPLAGGGNTQQIKQFNDLIRVSLEGALTENIGYATYPVHKEYPDVSLKGMMKMVDGVPPIDYWFSLKKTLRVLVRGLTVSVGLSLNPLTDEDKASIENYEKIFKLKGLNIQNPLLPLPATAFNNWAEDLEFARQFLNGVNPIMIEAVKNVPEQLSPEFIQHFSARANAIDLDALAKGNKLFYVDYKDLVGLEKNPHQAYPEAYNNPQFTDDQDILAKVGKEPRYFKAPIILFQMNSELQQLEILGIQLDREAGSKIFTVDNCSEDEWQFAKTTVAASDSQIHEWVSHLGKTHWTMEPHIAAIHNTLRRTNHPVYNFVKPMCRDTLLLNFAARFTLAEFGANSFGDYMTSVGTGQFMQLIMKYWEDYDFFKSCAVDEELASRGFTDDVDVPAYRYKTDAMKIWNAYGTFAKDFVDEVYADDQSVVDDSDLQAWAIETTSPNRAAVKGFPEQFESRDQLARTLQTLFWICSGLHAAVNFPQYDYYGYQANKPLGFRQSIEKRDAVDGDKAWLFEEGMPHMDKAQEAVVISSTLTLPSKHCITNLDEYFTNVGTNAYKTFKKNLDVISNEIDARSQDDKAKGNPTYEYLKPSNIPASIDI
mmetsp:Transcript_11515/g.33060  ORF Transcript_11515/g.33060 Transcript_11515/m.33060 type:complete len:762 (+) Transcript_11515:1487-3772(+)